MGGGEEGERGGGGILQIDMMECLGGHMPVGGRAMGKGTLNGRERGGKGEGGQEGGGGVGGEGETGRGATGRGRRRGKRRGHFTDKM